MWDNYFCIVIMGYMYIVIVEVTFFNETNNIIQVNFANDYYFNTVVSPRCTEL